MDPTENANMENGNADGNVDGNPLMESLSDTSFNDILLFFADEAKLLGETDESDNDKTDFDTLSIKSFVDNDEVLPSISSSKQADAQATEPIPHSLQNPGLGVQYQSEDKNLPSPLEQKDLDISPLKDRKKRVDKKVECPNCLQQFHVRALKKHKDRQHGVPGEKMFPCTHDMCNSSFTTKDSLRRHLEAVHDKVKVECQYCHKLYSPGNVRRHENTCGEKPMHGLDDADVPAKKRLRTVASSASSSN